MERDLKLLISTKKYLGIYLKILIEIEIWLPQVLSLGGLLLDRKPFLGACLSAGKKAEWSLDRMIPDKLIRNILLYFQ